jgi:hypothetical protein
MICCYKERRRKKEGLKVEAGGWHGMIRKVKSEKCWKKIEECLQKNMLSISHSNKYEWSYT